MQRHKSVRHQRAANARWREVAAQAERDAGIPDREPIEDLRQPFDLDLRTWGGRHLRIEPRHGYISARAVDADTGEVVACAALKTLLHGIEADEALLRQALAALVWAVGSEPAMYAKNTATAIAALLDAEHAKRAHLDNHAAVYARMLRARLGTDTESM